MHALPAEIPDAEVRRADLVEVRLARKVAPLFGLGDDIPPFRHSWVCDFTTLTLAEIGRGAPSPDRAGRSRLETALPDSLEAVSPGDAEGGVGPEWAWSGRAVWFRQHGALSGVLSNATLNRYGPDTKAAAVLSAANRLLRNAKTAVAAACRHLADGGCDAEVRLAVWAGLTIEVYRAQPALVVAAIQARQVQRSLSARWGMQVDRAGVTGPDAPSEIHPPVPDFADEDGAATRWRPTSFDLVDSTLPLLGLADDRANGLGLVTADALDDIASAWCHRLLGIGRPGRGVIWLAEDDQGSRRVHAMVRVGAVVAPFVAATLGGTAAGNRRSAPALPTLPTGDALANTPVLQLRAHLLTAHLAANYVRYRDELLLNWPQLRTTTQDLVQEAVQRCAEFLPDHDPVSLQLQAYAAYLAVWDRPRTRDGAQTALSNDIPGDGSSGWAEAVRRLIASQQRVVRAWQSRLLDPGTAAYLLEIGIVALRDTDACGLTDAANLTSEAPTSSMVDAWWSAILEARGLDLTGDLAAKINSLSPAQVFHLHHYAAWLARSGRRGDLRRALAVQERVAMVRAEVIRHEPAGFAAKSAAARAAYELATEIATDLALATPDRERVARTRALEIAVRYAQTVLADPSTNNLLRPAGPQPATLRTARVVIRALCTAMSHAVTVNAADAGAAMALMDSMIGTNEQSSDRRPDMALLATLRGWRTELANIRDAASGPDG